MADPPLGRPRRFPDCPFPHRAIGYVPPRPQSCGLPSGAWQLGPRAGFRRALQKPKAGRHVGAVADLSQFGGNAPLGASFMTDGLPGSYGLLWGTGCLTTEV